MATDTQTTPEPHLDPERKRLTPAEAFDVIDEQEEDLRAIEDLAQLVFLCAMGCSQVGFDDERDGAALAFVANQIKERVTNVKELRAQAWHGLWHHKQSRRHHAEAVS